MARSSRSRRWSRSRATEQWGYRLPLVPAKAGTQSQKQKPRIPAFAGMSGERVDRKFGVVSMSEKIAPQAKFGIKVRLQAAFGAVAIMTVVAAVVAIMSFSETQRGFERVSTREVPMMTDALRLSVASGEISAAAARYVAAKTSEDRKLIAGQIAARSRDLDQILNRLRVGQGEAGGFSIAEPMAQRLKENLKALEMVISERTDIRDKLDARLDALHKVHGKISDKLTPIVDDSYFEVVTTAEDVGQSGDITVRTLIQGGMQVMQAMVEVGAETNLITGLLTTGALTSSPGILAMLEDRFTASAR